VLQEVAGANCTNGGLKVVTKNSNTSEIINTEYLCSLDVGSVNSVTGLNTDNTDPDNPIVKISVDGTTITGLGTPASPLVASDATPFYIENTVNDAGNSKSSYIRRNGGVGASSFNTKKYYTYTGISDNNKWWKVFEYSLTTDQISDSFKIQANEFNEATGNGVSVFLDIVIKRLDPNVYLTVNVNSSLSSFNLSNFEALYNDTTKKISFYYRVIPTFTFTNWLVLNARATIDTEIVWYNTLIGTSLSGEINDTVTTKTISLNKVNGAFTLPTVAPTAGQVLAYSSAGVSGWGKVTSTNTTGASGSFTSNDGKTITVTNGLITNIV
jgi:hypothetical protein